MADWSPLRSALREVVSERTFGWHELDSMVGGLPRSAYVHNAFWKGSRAAWTGFSTTNVRVGHSVTFVRRASEPAGESPAHSTTMVSSRARNGADIVLVGCVKTKRAVASQAKDLYVSPLFRKEREYAETTGAPWFILSAEHGLVGPDEVLEPYERRLSDMPATYRRAWGTKVVGQLQAAVGVLEGLSIEVHAGSAYTDAIRAGLVAAGAHVQDPLQGLALGQRLAWYSGHPTPSPMSTRADVGELVARLQDQAVAQSVAQFLDGDDPAMRMPGLYSWWVDRNGAHELTAGLGHYVHAGLIYAGLAGATRSRSGLKSSNTLRGRIRGMHLGGRHNFSTFRLSLGSILASADHNDHIDEQRLTAWMHQHLRLIAVPVADADTLDALETVVLERLDPPLNLDKRPRTELRGRLSELRRRYGRT